MTNNKPIYEYDSNGNWIHSKDSTGYEEWYDSEGNAIDNATKEW